MCEFVEDFGVNASIVASVFFEMFGILHTSQHGPTQTTSVYRVCVSNLLRNINEPLWQRPICLLHTATSNLHADRTLRNKLDSHQPDTQLFSCCMLDKEVVTPLLTITCTSGLPSAQTKFLRGTGHDPSLKREPLPLPADLRTKYKKQEPGTCRLGFLTEAAS